MAEAAVRVFISYSHKDEDLRDRLDTHLSNLRWDGVISSWYDRQLTAGTEWDEKIKAELEAADIILLLISPDFIASKYCRDVEIPLSLQRHAAKQAFVVPIILRPFDWFTAPFAKLQAFPKDAKPVTTWPNQDEAFLSIAQGIRTAVQLMQSERQQLAEQQRVVRSQYRQKVEEALADGVISPVERDTLEELCETLGLAPEVAAEIEAEAQTPLRRYAENLKKYEKTLTRLIERGHYPFSAQIEQDLAQRQRDLGLEPEDVARLVQPILDQAERDYAAKPPQQPGANLRRLDNDIDLESPSANAGIQSHWFECDVVTVDQTGKETHRTRKTVEFFVEDLGGGVTLEMVVIPGGTFMMGSPNHELDRYDDEGPQHSVTVSAFGMGKFAVTQAQWRAVAALGKVEIDLDPDPVSFKGPNRPVEQVSWNQAMEFCARLSQFTGREYRLPSEAEWEYACRGGTTTPFHCGETLTPDLANYDGTWAYGPGPTGIYRKETTPVGTLPANAFGLYDMHGNVWEWCLDHWHANYAGAPTDGSAWLSDEKGSSRLLRGGAWLNDPGYCRSAYRDDYNPDFADRDIGFRVVCVAPRTL
jgi:formylglycine-generating enzyme required for sulfatase activity